ncbi:hypothetical protein [Desulfoplanes sp.]
MIKLADNVWMSVGHSVSNVGMIVGDDGVIIVDTGLMEADARNIHTLVFNFKLNVMYSSNLLGYGTEREKIGFHGGIIEHVQR